MGSGRNHDSHDDLIQSYLECEATPDEEEQFRLLLGSESFRRRVAEYAVDLGHICDQVRQGVIESLSSPKGKDARSRRVIGAAVVAASLLLAVGIAFSAVWWRELSREVAGDKPSDVSRQVKVIESIGHVANVKGTVLVADFLEGSDRRAIAEGAKLGVGDALFTVGESSFALVELADDSVLAVAGNTELELSVSGSQKRFVLRRGDVMAQVVPQPVRKPMLLETPLARAEVVGTTLSLFASLGLTQLAVLEGHVRLTRLTDGTTIDVEEGYTAVASEDSAFSPEPLVPVTSLWEEGFDTGVPADWELGSWTRAGSSPTSEGAVRAVRPSASREDPNSQFFVASSRDWWRGLFRIEEDTHLNFTYSVAKADWFNVMIETRSDAPDRVYSGVFVYRNPIMWNSRLNQWRTVSVPLKFFAVPKEAKIKRGPPLAGEYVFRFYFSTAETDPGLVIDRVWVTRGPADSAEILGRGK